MFDREPQRDSPFFSLYSTLFKQEIESICRYFCTRRAITTSRDRHDARVDPPISSRCKSRFKRRISAAGEAGEGG